MNFDTPAADKFEGKSFKYTYICGYCDVRWCSNKTVEKCWSCDRPINIVKSMNEMYTELAKDYQISFDEARIVHTDDEEDRPR